MGKFGFAHSILALFLSFVAICPVSASTVRCEALFAPFTFEKSQVVESNWFVTTRNLAEYRQYLTREFANSLDALGPREMWIDFGAGKAFAAEDYLTSGPLSQKADVLAITYKYGRWFPKYSGPKLKVQKGRFFEELTTLPEYHLGSDLYGIFSYSKHIDHYFQLSLSKLAIGRKHFIFANFFRTVIVKKNGERVDVARWLSEVSGQKVEHLKSGILVITKQSAIVTIPRVRLIATDDQTPPGRVFEEY